MAKTGENRQLFPPRHPLHPDGAVVVTAYHDTGEAERVTVRSLAEAEAERQAVHLAAVNAERVKRGLPALERL